LHVQCLREVNSKALGFDSWDSKVELTMPGEVKLYRDYELTDVSEYASSAGKKGGATDANPETKKANKFAPNLKNKDGYDNKWEHAGKKAANKLVDDGTGKGTMVKACVKMAKIKANTVRANCITCNMVPRQGQSDKCNQCQLAAFNM
jgi:hypothetical protein